MDYTIVTKQETSATDAKFVTERAHVSNDQISLLADKMSYLKPI